MKGIGTRHSLVQGGVQRPDGCQARPRTGEFIDSVLNILDAFYGDVVQPVKLWAGDSVGVAGP